MKNTHVFAAAACFAVIAACAPSDARAQNAPGEFKLKNRSSFDISGEAHNPFWPIGWAKSQPLALPATLAPAEIKLNADDFSVTSILLNEPPIAVINGKELAEGEMIQMQVGAQKFIVQLASVQDGRVVLRYLNKNLVVPFRRKGEPLPAAAAAVSAASAPAATASR
jgi:hypothetical protein